MFERHHEKLLTPAQFAMRVVRHLGISAGIIAAALAIGVIGYHTFEDMGWIDSLLNASMILGGMGPVDHLNTDAGKIFASIYAMFSGLVFVGAAGLVLGPLLHRMMHRMHADRM